MPLPRPSESTRHRGALADALRALGVRPWWLALLLVAHLGFGLARAPVGAIWKRAESIGEWNRLGPAAWHFRLMDEETVRIADWLASAVGPDECVLFEGSTLGAMQLLAPLVFPGLPLRSDARATPPAGYRLFTEPAPWLDPPDGAVPVVIATNGSLRLDYR